MSAFQCIDNSIKGTNRVKNKDRIWIVQNKNYVLAVLFDGISSAKEANSGINIATDFLSQSHGRFFNGDSFMLANLMFEVNSRIVATNLNSPFTTYSAVYLNLESAEVKFSNLGDSRIYEVSPQYLKKLTEDDNLPYEKNIVTKHLGMLQLRQDDFYESSLSVKGKRLLLCSDGFYSIMEKKLSRFFDILNFKKKLNIKKKLDLEIKNNNFDDASYILIL